MLLRHVGEGQMHKFVRHDPVVFQFPCCSVLPDGNSSVGAVLPEGSTVKHAVFALNRDNPHLSMLQRKTSVIGGDSYGRSFDPRNYARFGQIEGTGSKADVNASSWNSQYFRAESIRAENIGACVLSRRTLTIVLRFWDGSTEGLKPAKQD